MLQSVKAVVEEKHAKAIFLGTRRTDPYSGNLDYFAESDHQKGWPKFMRILPILDFNYRQIWDFMRVFEVNYCTLYDQGYTYLGDKTDSVPNPFSRLRKNEGLDYKPAFDSKENYEPYSRKSIFGKLDLNFDRRIIVGIKNVGGVVIRTNNEVDPLRVLEQMTDTVQMALLGLELSNPNLVVRVQTEQIIDRCENLIVITDNFESDEELSLKLETIQRDLIVEKSLKGKRIPLYILYIDYIRKTCFMFE